MIVVLALISWVELATVLALLLVVGATEVRIAENVLAGAQAFYLAESGLEMALVELRAGEPSREGRRLMGHGHVVVWRTVQDADHVEVVAHGQVGTALRIVRNVFERGSDGWRPLAQFSEETP
jgi:hypothetical protein